MDNYFAESPTWLKVRTLTDERPDSPMNASLGFTEFHAALLDICFGLRRVDPSKVESVRGQRQLDKKTDLDKLMYMVLVEFAESLETDHFGDTESQSAKDPPRPYDVFVMKTAFGQASIVAVLFPMKKRKLLWWTGQDDFEDCNSPHYKIASLSGPARVLEGLQRAKRGSPLSSYAMLREKVIKVVEEEEAEPEPQYTGSGNTHYRRSSTIIDDPSLLESLNHSQQQAVEAVLRPSFEEGFLAIQGPPGCGKTTTMVRMISAIGSGMIVAAPSNAAVANLALKLFESGRFPFGDMCVFGDGCNEAVQFLNPRFRSDQFKDALQRRSDCEQPNKDSETIERQRDSVRLELARWLRLRDDSTMKDLMHACPDVQVDNLKSVTSTGWDTIGRILLESKVVLCTLNSSGSSFLHGLLARRTFLLDEGGQCTEAEFFLATTFPGVKRVVVMGDPKQLRSTVLSPTCSAAGFGESWLGNIYLSKNDCVHLLDTQYRMDPSILCFPNRRFYNERIQSGESVFRRSPDVSCPFCFIDTQGRGREEYDENKSVRNSYEVAVVNECLRNDSDIAALLSADSPPRIIVISPYKAQSRLLAKMTKSYFRSLNVDVLTADAVQGQEADIVIISMVRTHRVGFVDDPQRLNVALTRAKRVLRIIGDREFFENQPKGSTLRALSRYVINVGDVRKSSMRRLPNCPPDLSIQTQWKVTLTQRFHNSISLMCLEKKNVSLNTLFTVARPDLTGLANRIAEKSGWHTSYLKGYEDVRIIWVARDHEDIGIVEAHFAGTKSECLRFRQCHRPPDGCCTPRADMSSIVPEELSPPENGRMFVSWALNNNVQNAMLNDEKLLNLPLSMIQLDPLQDRIARSPPPLLLESRSGTGKTLVLLQHAAFYCRISDTRPACFVTVSSGLRNELDKKYHELTPIHGAGLPETQFYTFHELIKRLVSHHGIRDFEGRHLCTFRGYLEAQYKHHQPLVDSHLVENEIGGVIAGSLVAAEQKHAMTRDQYLAEIRSNVRDKREGRKVRNLVYDEYRHYHEWKRISKMYDIGDAVLRLLQQEQQQLFASGMLFLPRCDRRAKQCLVIVQRILMKFKISLTRQYTLSVGWPEENHITGCAVAILHRSVSQLVGCQVQYAKQTAVH